jgi:choline kinase
MLSSLSCASQWLKSDVCIISYSDIFYDHLAIESLKLIDSDLAISYDPNWLSLWTRRFGDPLLDAETFRLNKESRLLEIGRRPKSVGEIEGQYMGLIRLSPKGWSEIERLRLLLEPSERDAKHMTGILQEVVEANRVPIDAIAYKGIWGEVDTPEDLSLYSSK